MLEIELKDLKLGAIVVDLGDQWEERIACVREAVEMSCYERIRGEDIQFRSDTRGNRMG